MSKIYDVISEKCVGCGICANQCPVGAITIQNKKAMISEKCVGCAICYKSCRMDAISLMNVSRESVGCECCPVNCNIPAGGVGACQRFFNENGVLKRIEPLNIVDKDAILLDPITKLPNKPLLLGLGAGTNLYSEYVPSKFVGGATVDGVDIVTCVTEAVLSFSGVKVKIDTDEELGSGGSSVKVGGKTVGYIAPAEYGSRMMYIGGAELITGADGFIVAKTMIDLLNKKQVTLRTEAVKELILQEGKPPIIDDKITQKMRVGCGSMVSAGFTKRFMGLVDEIITLDFDVTATMSTHNTAGARFGMKPSGITPVGKYSSPGRYFGTPGTGWGGSNVMCAKDAIASIDKNLAWPGLRLLVTETNVERATYFELDENLEPVEKPMPEAISNVLKYISDTCEPCRTNITVVAGLGGGVRGVIVKDDILQVNRVIREGLAKITICGQATNLLPGGGITVEAPIFNMPAGAFAWVATPATVVPIEFTMTKDTYSSIGGYVEAIKPIDQIASEVNTKIIKL